MTDIPVNMLRQAALVMADWLEHRHFGVTLQPGTDPERGRECAACWAEGYRRAIHELRWAAQEPVIIPDDISELDSGGDVQE